MDKKKLIYLAFGTLLMLPSCSQETPTNGGLSGSDHRIYFRSYLPAVDLTRAGAISQDNFNTCQVTCFNPDDNEYIDSITGDITPYFNDIRFEKAADGRFLSVGDEDCRWPDSENTLHFFAYYPTADSMRNFSDENSFIFENASNHAAGKSVIDYKLKNFRVAKDIANQSDFLTAYTSGILTKDADKGIKLDVKHQMARIEISAWSGSEKYDFEIAGVRIGNPLVEADFDFTALMPGSGKVSPWLNKNKQDSVQHIFGPGESIVHLSNKLKRHNTEDDAASIMGSAGPAMVLPMNERVDAWEGKADPNTAFENYSTDKMYFSVLLRVINNAGEVAYPFPNDRENMTVVYLAIDSDGKVTRRLYKKDKNSTEYYTNSKTSEMSEATLYTPKSGETICGFGWASLPLPANWEAGKIYTYKLNYTNGIGWHDPADPSPGEPIIERAQIPFAVNVEDWTEATGYDPNLDVPKR